MVARWRLQLIAETQVGTKLRAAGAVEDRKVRKLRSVTR
jgi:hypothetical protein